MADHARAAADRPFLRQAARGVVERGEHMLRLHVEAIDVVQTAVVGLGDDRQPPRLQHVLLGNLPPDDGVPHDADAVGIGHRHRPFQQPALLDPGRAGHFAVAVQREPRGEDRLRVAFPARVDHRHTGAHRSRPHHQLSASGNEGGLADFDARHVGDGVEWSRRPADGQLEIPLSRLLRVQAERGGDDQEQGDDRCSHHEPREDACGEPAHFSASRGSRRYHADRVSAGCWGRFGGGAPACTAQPPTRSASK